MLVDKYRPRTLDNLMVHKEEATNLKNLIAPGDRPHLLFYGPSGAGKKTLIMTLLREMFGPSAEKDSKVQHSLRRTMEKYSAACRLILCCSSASKVIEAVRSRCLNVRINSPSRDEVVDVLMFVAGKENLVLPPELGGRIAYHFN